MSSTKNVVSAITLSGSLTIAHYLMVLKPLLNLSQDHNLFLFLADLHATTTSHNSHKLQFLTKTTASYLFACGFKEAEIFIQSQINGLGKLCFLLGSYTSIGVLKRMTQFKTKSAQTDFQNLALLNYPLLMASDILLYDADVLVGNDQKQHIELTRNLAERINNQFSSHLFHLPNLLSFPFFAYRIRDLQNPLQKMSKSSSNPHSIIFLHDNEKIIREKIIKSKTDSENKISVDFAKKPGVSNLILLYALAKNLSLSQAETFLAKTCHDYLQLKITVSDALVAILKPLQIKANYLQKNYQKIQKNLELGRKRAQNQVSEKMSIINKHFGF